MKGKLHAQQKAFFRAVRFDPAPADTLPLFASDERLDAAARLSVYRDMYWYRQVDALANTFSATREVIGPERFTKLAVKYIRDYPSTHFALEHLGHTLPRFLREAATTPVKGVMWRDEEEALIAADIADLEWHGSRSLLSADPPAVAPAQHAATPDFPRARLAFVPSLQTVTVRHHAWRLFCERWSPAQEESADPSQPPQATIVVAFWRKRFGVRQRALTALEARTLQAAVAGATVAEALAHHDDASVHAAFHMLREWFAQHWIAAVHLE